MSKRVKKKKRNRRTKPQRKKFLGRNPFLLFLGIPVVFFAWGSAERYFAPTSADRELSVLSTTDSAKPKIHQIETAMDLAADYLCSQIKKEGQFVYRINLNNKVRVKPRYNILRHAGTIYALGTYNEVYPSQIAEEVILQAGDFLRQQIEPVPDHLGCSAIWSHRKIHHRNRAKAAKLGGTGLGLVALLTEERLRPGATDPKILCELGNFLLLMQQPDGGFYSKYVPSKGGFDDWVSLYYPGEAALGLVMLYEHDPNPKWLASASGAMEFLARTREGDKEVPADHWALLATSRLLSHIDNQVQRELHERLIGHTIQICNSILRSQQPLLNDPIRAGSFDDQGRTTPCATRMEGLQAALSYLPVEQAFLRKRIKESCDLGINFLLRAQIVQGYAMGGFPRSIFGNPPFADQVASKKDRRWPEIRIDYVQHALSALLQYRERLMVNRSE